MSVVLKILYNFSLHWAYKSRLIDLTILPFHKIFIIDRKFMTNFKVAYELLYKSVTPIFSELEIRAIAQELVQGIKPMLGVWTGTENIYTS